MSFDITTTSPQVSEDDAEEKVYLQARLTWTCTHHTLRKKYEENLYQRGQAAYDRKLSALEPTTWEEEFDRELEMDEGGEEFDLEEIEAGWLKEGKCEICPTNDDLTLLAKYWMSPVVAHSATTSMPLTFEDFASYRVGLGSGKKLIPTESSTRLLIYDILSARARLSAPTPYAALSWNLARSSRGISSGDHQDQDQEPGSGSGHFRRLEFVLDITLGQESIFNIEWLSSPDTPKRVTQRLVDAVTELPLLDLNWDIRALAQGIFRPKVELRAEEYEIA